MISAFGIISLIVLVVSAVLLYWHSRLMKLRGAVDFYLENISEVPETTPEELKTAIESYNDTVKIYNEYIVTPPGMVSAALVGLKEELLMELPE